MVAAAAPDWRAAAAVTSTILPSRGGAPVATRAVSGPYARLTPWRDSPHVAGWRTPWKARRARSRHLVSAGRCGDYRRGMAAEPDPDTGTRPAVVCVGMLTVDLVQTVVRMPGANEKVPGLRQSLTFGGPAANAAATAAALGADVLLIAGFGSSAFTPVVARLLDDAGVRWQDPAASVPSPSPLSTVVLTEGTGFRAVIGGAAPPLPPGADISPGLIESAGALLLDGHAMPVAREAARRARAAGIPVVFDGGSYKEGTAQLLGDVDLAVLSADFRAPGDADPLAWVRLQGCRSAARSAGAGPIRLLDDSGGHHVAVPTIEVADTLGAGDVLHGATVFAVARWGAADAQRVLRFAAAIASLSCGHPGALGWAQDPAPRAAARRLADHGPDPPAGSDSTGRP